MATSSQTGRPHRPPALLLTFILAAVAFGIAAVVLATPLASPPPVSTSSSGGFTLNDAAILAEALLLALIVVPLILYIVGRSSGTTVLPKRQITLALVIILLLTVFVFVLHTPGGGLYCTPQICGGSTGGGSGTAGGGNNSSSGVIPPPGQGQSYGFTIPPWVLWFAVLGIGIVAAVVLVPLFLARHTAPSRGPGRDAELRSDLTAAIDQLSEATGGTPRERVIRVYARFLGRVTRGAGDLSTLTAREIEAICVERLGIRPETAHALTSLFEEARYSMHPLGEEVVSRAQGALTMALDEFDRRMVMTVGTRA